MLGASLESVKYKNYKLEAAAEKAACAALDPKQNKSKIVLLSDYSLKFSAFKRFGGKF